MKNKEKQIKNHSQLGGNHQLFSDTPSEKELSQCYTCESGLHKFVGGGKRVYATIDAFKNNNHFSLEVCYGDKYDINITNLSSKRKSKKTCKNIRELRDALSKFHIDNYEIVK